LASPTPGAGSNPQRMRRGCAPQPATTQIPGGGAFRLIGVRLAAVSPTSTRNFTVTIPVKGSGTVADKISYLETFAPGYRSGLFGVEYGVVWALFTLADLSRPWHSAHCELSLWTPKWSAKLIGVPPIVPSWQLPQACWLALVW